jgi:ABC-type branched-subunit amino acid transport system substrate-binding protein
MDNLTRTYARLAIAGITIAVVAVVMSGCSLHTAVPEPRVIKIGVIGPTTGPAAILGTSFQKTVELAREDLRGTKYTYELVVEDSGETPEQAERAIRKLVEVDKVSAIVGGISKTGEVVQPYATAARIPHICVCSVRTIGDGEYNFTNIPLPEDEAVRWVEEALKRGIESIAVLSEDYPSIDGHVKALKEEAARAGIRVVYERRFAASTTDFRSTVAEAQSASPDVYFVEASTIPLDILGQQLKDVGVDNIASIVAPALSAKPELFEGVWYTDSNLVDPEFIARFERRYPGQPFVTHMMPYAYASFNLLVQGFESGSDVAEYVRGVYEYESPAGELTRERGSGNFRSTPTVWVIKDGKPEFLY